MVTFQYYWTLLIVNDINTSKESFSKTGSAFALNIQMKPDPKLCVFRIVHVIAYTLCAYWELDWVASIFLVSVDYLACSFQTSLIPSLVAFR